MKSFSSKRVSALVQVSFSVSLLILSACGSKGGKSNATSSAGTPTCKISNQKLAEALSEKPSLDFVAPLNKVARNDFLQNSSIIGSSKIQNSLLKRDQKVVLTVDRLCLEKRIDSSEFLLTEKIKAKSKSHKYSVHESHSFTLPADMSFETLEAIAKSDECVEMISPDIDIRVSALPNDVKRSKQTHLPAIKYNDTHDFYFTGAKSINSDTIIAIIDDGVDINHEDLKDILWVNTAEKNGSSGVDDDGNGLIDDINGYDFASNTGNPNHKTPAGAQYSHGTHVAGLVASSTNNSIGISGLMARNAKIMALNVFGSSSSASLSKVDTAIRYAADMGAKVINLSLGGPGTSTSTQNALKYAVSKGATVLLAAGNDGQTISSSNPFTPAIYGAGIDGVITIGATDANPTKVGTLCGFSNRSTSYVELGAPGCDTGNSSTGIYSSFKSNQYGYMAGTSMASPIAAGSTAVIYSFVRDAHSKVLTPAEVENLMKSGSRNIASINSYIKDGKNVDLLTLKTKIEADFGPIIIPPEEPEEPQEPEIPECP